MKRLAALACIGLTACGQAARSATPTPTPSPSRSAHELLFAAEKGQFCGTNCASSVVIAGTDGRIHAQASLTPPAGPSIGCEGSFVAATVQVAAGSVYYLDSGNAVHRLSVSGDNRIVAK